MDRKKVKVILRIVLFAIIVFLYMTALSRTHFKCSEMPSFITKNTELSEDGDVHYDAQGNKDKAKFLDLPDGNIARGLGYVELSFTDLFLQGIVYEFGLFSFEKGYKTPIPLLVCEDRLVFDDNQMFGTDFFDFKLEHDFTDIDGDGDKDLVLFGDRYLYSIAWVNDKNESFAVKPRIIFVGNLFGSLFFLLSRVFVLWAIFFIIAWPLLFLMKVSIRNRLLIMAVCPVFPILFFISRISIIGKTWYFLYLAIYLFAILYLVIFLLNRLATRISKSKIWIEPEQ